MPKESKPVTIRLEPELHARLGMLARLANQAVTDVIREGIEDKLDKLASDPEIADRAEDLRERIEREAAEQRDALQGLFGDTKPTAKAVKTTPSAKTTG